MTTKDKIAFLTQCFKTPRMPRMPIDEILAGIAECTTDAGTVITSRRYRYQILIQELEKHNPNR